MKKWADHHKYRKTDELSHPQPHPRHRDIPYGSDFFSLGFATLVRKFSSNTNACRMRSISQTSGNRSYSPAAGFRANTCRCLVYNHYGWLGVQSQGRIKPKRVCEIRIKNAQLDYGCAPRAVRDGQLHLCYSRFLREAAVGPRQLPTGFWGVHSVSLQSPIPRHALFSLVHVKPAYGKPHQHG